MLPISLRQTVFLFPTVSVKRLTENTRCLLNHWRSYSPPLHPSPPLRPLKSSYGLWGNALSSPPMGLAQSPSRYWIWCILALKYYILWQQFKKKFPENRLYSLHNSKKADRGTEILSSSRLRWTREWRWWQKDNGLNWRLSAATRSFTVTFTGKKWESEIIGGPLIGPLSPSPVPLNDAPV